jgi:hypothetical protein
MYDHNEHEVSDCLVHAYKNYSFQKIPKIVEFLNRCTKSVFATGADVMNRWLSACFSLDSLGTVASTLAGDKITDKEWDEIIDNRDFSIMPVTMLPNVLERVQNESFQEIKAFLKLKHLLCRSIGLIGSTLNSGDFLSTTKAIFSHLDHCKEKFSVENDLGKNLISFSNISVHELISCGQLELPLFFVRLAQHLRAEINGKERESENENNNVDGKTADSFDFDKHLPSISELESALKGIAIFLFLFSS